MLHDYILVAAGTAATIFGILLLALRLEVSGRRPALVLTRQWVAADRRKTSAVMSLAIATAAASFASVQPNGAFAPPVIEQNATHTPILEQISADPEAEADFNSLAAYASSIATGKPQSQPSAPAAETQNLPDVSIMIDNLKRRLESEPNDARGWKMLGWSYLNTEQPQAAVTAYEKALALAPADEDAKKGLDQARAAAAKQPVNKPQ